MRGLLQTAPPEGAAAGSFDKERRPAACRTPLPALPLFAGFEEQRGEKAKEHRRGDARGGGGETAGEDAQPAVLPHRTLHALGQVIAKARQGDGSTRPAPGHNVFVDTDGLQKDAGDHIPHQDPRRGQLGFVDENLLLISSLDNSTKH